MTKQLSKPMAVAFTREQVDLIKQTVARGTTDTELSLYLYAAQRTGLDPLLKQIHAVKRWDSAAGKDVMSIQTGIDGYRLIADRTGKLAGIDDAEFDREDREYPEKATVTVYKIINGEVRPFTASARWREFCAFKKDGSPMFLWKKMGYHMLGKCAEAQALRKAFPQELSGIYTFEEMSSENLPVTTLEIKSPNLSQNNSGSGTAVASVGSGSIPTQPEDSPADAIPSEATPAPKAAARKVSKVKVSSPMEDTLQSNYSRLLGLLHVGGYSGEDFMVVAHKNMWFPTRIKTLNEIPDPDLLEFVKPDNLQIMMDQLEQMPRHTKD